jgi:transcriptional regulator with XRE-family HTH domain
MESGGLSSFVKRRRQALGLTQQSLADKSGLSRGVIALIERGFEYTTNKPYRPYPDTLRLLAQGLESDYEFLLSLAGYLELESKVKEASAPYNIIKKIDAELAQNLLRLPAKKIELIKKIVAAFLEG